MTDTPVRPRNLANALAPAVTGQRTGSCGRPSGRRASVADRGQVRRRKARHATAPAIQVVGAGVGAGGLRRHDPFNGFGAHRRRRRRYAIDITQPVRGRLRPAAADPLPADRRLTRGQVAACDPAAAASRRQPCVLSIVRRAPAQGGFFLIEAMVAILIFSLGILGLVAMGGTAVSSQSDAQYRTEASSLADAIAGQIALGVDRTNAAAMPASLADVRASARRRADRAARSPARHDGGATPSVADVLGRAANATARGPARRDGRRPADHRRRRRQLQPRRDHAVLEDRERQRLASPHARDLRQLRPSMHARLSRSARGVARAACRWSRSWSASPSA